MLVRLLYASRATDAIDKKLIDSILAQSHTYNAAHGITGVLCACDSGNIFLQALEGGRDAVNLLYQKLIRDSRHRDITLLEYAEIGERRFSNWRMGRVDMNRVNVVTVLRYSESPRLDPFRLSGASALALLEDLSTTAAVMARTDSK